MVSTTIARRHAAINDEKVDAPKKRSALITPRCLCGRVDSWVLAAGILVTGDKEGSICNYRPATAKERTRVADIQKVSLNMHAVVR